VWRASHGGRNSRYGYEVVRTLAALLLLAAAGLKAYQLSTEPVSGTGLLESSRWLLMAVVEFELFFGLWLISELLPWPLRRSAGGEGVGVTWLAALICFAVFSFVSLYKGISGYETCGCFGKIKVTPWYTAMLDLSVVLSLLWFRPTRLLAHFRGELKALRARLAGVLALWFFFAVPSAVAMALYRAANLSDAGFVVGDGRAVLLEPENWTGKRFPLLDYIDVGDQLREGAWLVLLYHHDCPKCRDAIGDLGWITCHMCKARIALIEMPPCAQADHLLAETKPFVCGRLRSDREWFAHAPVFVGLHSGIVMSAGSWSIRNVMRFTGAVVTMAYRRCHRAPATIDGQRQHQFSQSQDPA
jgi:hypothetical protein